MKPIRKPRSVYPRFHTTLVIPRPNVLETIPYIMNSDFLWFKLPDTSMTDSVNMILKVYGES